MATPQQPEVHRSGRSATDPASARAKVDRPPPPKGDAGPVPEGNRPGRRPRHQEDKPVAAFRELAEEVAEEAQPDRFRFAFEPRMAAVAAAFGVTPWTAWVDVRGPDLSIRFGPWSLTTRLDNVESVQPTGPYRFWRVAGPARLSLADRGLTMATSTARGVCIRFREPVPGIVPAPLPGRGLVRHPGVTVTVEDGDRLIRRLGRDAKPRLRAS